MSNTMREILFRGKSVDNEEWIYGSFIPDLLEVYQGDKNVDGIIKPFGKTKEERLMVEVLRETVGQFTGLTDKNGTKIFEGDIIKHYNCTADSTRFDIGLIFWDTNKCRFVRTSKDGNDIYEIWRSYMNDYEVIGNIHDNPELLEVNNELQNK